jgi:hypothetical protein
MARVGEPVVAGQKIIFPSSVEAIDARAEGGPPWSALRLAVTARWTTKYELTGVAADAD